LSVSQELTMLLRTNSPQNCWDSACVETVEMKHGAAASKKPSFPTVVHHLPPQEISNSGRCIYHTAAHN